LRLWHVDLIPYLPRLQLLGQHRECCALRGKGWGKKHSTVDYVFKYSLNHLFIYHLLVLNEMKNREYKINNLDWYCLYYRGKKLGMAHPDQTPFIYSPFIYSIYDNRRYYPEHNADYLKECLELLNERILNEPWKYNDDEKQVNKFFDYYDRRIDELQQSRKMSCLCS
jgi:uncharacterized protein (TIGR02328 family)